MSLTIAVVLCLGLTAVDFAARTWRMQLYLRGIGRRIPFREVLLQSLVAEAGATITPLRIGSDPSRLWAMRRSGVSTTVAAVCIGVETVVLTVITVLVSVVLMLTVARDWWALVGPQLVASLRAAWPYVVAVFAASVVSWLVARLYAPRVRELLGREMRAVRRYARVMPRSAYWWSLPVTLLNMSARVAILPVLALTLPEPPPLGAMLVGSYALLYGQLIAPTPGGAGAVELVFLAGAAGELGAEAGALLLAWRLITAVLPLVLGLATAVLHYGLRVFGEPARVRRRRSAAQRLMDRVRRARKAS